MQRSGLSSETPLKTDLEQSKEAIKSEIHKQLKLKEGAENFKKVATDKKTKARCKSILKEANVTIQDLHDGLQDLNARVPEDVLSENDDSLSPDKTSGVSNGSGSSKIEYLKKEMAHEMKFKKGAENLHAAVCSDSQSKKKDSKRTAEVKRPLEDSRRKVEILRMALLREQRQGTRVGREDGVLMGNSTGKENDGAGSVGLSPLELRVEDVRYRIEIESSVMQGANIMIKSLSESGQDKGLVEAKEVVHESRQILDLLHCSLSRLIGEQFPQQAALGIYKDYNILPSNADRKSEALTGVLDVCIIGADRLLADVPNRDPRKLSLAIVSPDGKIVECTGFNKRKRGCTKWSLDKSLSVEICSVLKLDNIYVGQTSWNALGTECWKERFHILLDKSRELEVGVYWRDYRSLCGVAFLRLEEFLDNKQHQIQVPLIPQGYLFAEVIFRIPVVKKRPRPPQQQKNPFDIHKGKTFPQTGQMNTKFNVATRAELQTTTPPPNCTTNNSTLCPKFNIPFPRDRAENFDEQAPLVDCGKVPEHLESSHTSSQVNSDNLMRGQQELSYASVTKTKPIRNCEKENTPPDKRKTKNPMIQENRNKDDCSTAASRSCYSDSYSHSSIDQPRASYIRGNSKRKKSLCGPIDSLSEIEIPQTNSIHYAQGSSGEVEDKINQEEPITINSPYSCIGSHQTMPKVERPGVPIDMPADHSNASESFLHSFAGSKKYMPEAGIPVVFAQDNHVCVSDGLKHSTTTDDVMEDETNRKNRAESLEARFVEDLRAERESLTDEWSKYCNVLCDGLNDVADSDHSDTVRHTTLSGCDSTDNVEEISESEDLRGVTVLSKCWDILKSILRYIYIFLVLILDFLLRCIWCAGCWSVKSVVHYTALDRLFAVLRRRTSSLFEWIKSFRRSEKKDSTQEQTYNDADDITHMLQKKDDDPYSVLGVPSDDSNDDNRKHKAAFDEIDGRRLLSGKGIEDRNLAQLPSDVVKSLMSDSCSPEEIVVQLKESLHLGEKCLEQPNPETKRTIRCLAKRANDLNRIDVVKHLREITPAGTTGPLLPGNLDIRNIHHSQMRELTIDLSGGEEWKDVAEKLGLSPKEIRYLDKRIHNPCDAALASISQRRHITVDDLYDVLTECGYPMLADTL